MADETPGDVSVEDQDIDIPIDELEADDHALEDAMGRTMESAADAATPNPGTSVEIPEEPPTIPGAPPTLPDSKDRVSLELELGDDDIVAEVVSETAPPRPPPSRKPPPPSSLTPTAPTTAAVAPCPER